MKYMGSKNRIAKYILPIMLTGRKPDQYWVEPFVGGANMIDKVTGNRIGADLNEYVIALLKKMSKEEFSAPMINKDTYKMIKNDKEQFEKWVVGYAGTQLSFGSTWFGSYRRDNKGIRNYCLEAQNNVNKQAGSLKSVIFTSCSYQDLVIPPNSIIYCDPPYDTEATKGKYKDSFEHKDFWQWCRDKEVEGHKVFISEYNAPKDFKCIYQKEITQRMNNNADTKKGIERLFEYCG